MRPLHGPEGKIVYQTNPSPAQQILPRRNINQFRRLQRLSKLCQA